MKKVVFFLIFVLAIPVVIFAADNSAKYNVMQVCFKNYSQFTSMTIDGDMEYIYSMKTGWKISSDGKSEWSNVKVRRDGNPIEDDAFLVRDVDGKKITFLSTYYFSRRLDKEPLPSLFPVEVLFPNGEKITLTF